ncbi:hypothetical protein PG988_006930 [Apiospora saccharicola]
MAGSTGISDDFAARKRKILAQLAVPDAEYTDASPKGNVDAGIRDLIDELNGLDGFVTTSSCGGRVSVFVEGVKKKGAAGQSQAQETVGGDDVEVAARTAGMTLAAAGILHVLTASPAHAQLLLRCGLQAGFRESGAINLTAPAAAGTEATPTPMVAIRCMGLTFESLVGVKKNDRVQCTVTPAYLRTLVDIGNERFAENTRRIQRFRSAVLEAVAAPAASGPKIKVDGSVWEDAQARRERKKAEGLKKKEELQNQQIHDQFLENTVVAGDNGDADLALNTAFT